MKAPQVVLPNASFTIGRLRAQAGLTQAQLATRVGLDQSRVSRIEKGELASPADLSRLLDALVDMNAAGAASYREFLNTTWQHLERPAFWNPERAMLELSEEVLGQIASFLAAEEVPWPLQRQIERQRLQIHEAASYLLTTTHHIACIGPIGVGKSTALSFLFGLVKPEAAGKSLPDRVVLESGGGGTTLCEVRVRRGPDFGIFVEPLAEDEVRALVGDFCAARWLQARSKGSESGDPVGVSSEVDRAIRNMTGLAAKAQRGRDGKVLRRDLVAELVLTCGSEEELRTKVLDRMQLHKRTRRELWFDNSLGKSPLTWMSDIFSSLNKGRISDAPWPGAIDLLIPSFAEEMGDLEIDVVDTKGIDDIAVREDLDARLKDARTAIVVCSRFEEAPGAAGLLLLEHLRKTFAGRIDAGKVAILALPRANEAMTVKDDSGDLPIDERDGYELKQTHITRKLAASEHDLGGAPVLFFNAEKDDPVPLRASLFGQVQAMRQASANRLLELCAAVDDLIRNHEQGAVNAAIEEVAASLGQFLGANRALKARERHAYKAATEAVNGARYAATVWAATRRNGQYPGLNLAHQVGVGAAQDAILRSREWFTGLRMHLGALRVNPGLALAVKTIDQIEQGIDASRGAFAEAVQTAGAEVYREPLQQANEMWSLCAGEWGCGPGFKTRVLGHLGRWFDESSVLKDRLESITLALWEEKVIKPIERLALESSPGSEDEMSNVVQLENHRLDSRLVNA